MLMLCQRAKIIIRSWRLNKIQDMSHVQYVMFTVISGFCVLQKMLVVGLRQIIVKCVCVYTDCCVHCVLACLFCELLPMCSAVAQCLACGMECDTLCCCGEACGGLACCSGDPCSALLDCAILEDCCQSSECLEICLECCSICFPT